MPLFTASAWWSTRLGLAAAAGGALLGLAQAIRSGAEPPGAPPVLVVQESIVQVDARLLANGWLPNPEREPLLFERERAGNRLASLSACLGTGLGLCRYDYQRGKQALAVVTVPGARGEGVVHSWFDPEVAH